MSTLPPNPSFNPNIPIVSSAGGTSAAYKNPNSPESIMKTLTILQVQTAVDQKYDVAQSPYYKEAFVNFSSSSDMIRILIACIIILLICLVAFKTLRFVAKVFLLTLAVVSSLLVIHLYVRNVNDK
jgi:hypothetical protein